MRRPDSNRQPPGYGPGHLPLIYSALSKRPGQPSNRGFEGGKLWKNKYLPLPANGCQAWLGFVFLGVGSGYPCAEVFFRYRPERGGVPGTIRPPGFRLGYPLPRGQLPVRLLIGAVPVPCRSGAGSWSRAAEAWRWVLGAGWRRLAAGPVPCRVAVGCRAGCRSGDRGLLHHDSGP